MGLLKARVALVHCAIFHVLEPGFHTFIGHPHNPILARLDLLHVHRNGPADQHTKLWATPGHISGTSAGNQGLGWYTACIDTGSPEELALDDSHLHPCAGQPSCQRRPRLPRANDYRVIVGHHRTSDLLGWFQTIRWRVENDRKLYTYNPPISATFI